MNTDDMKMIQAFVDSVARQEANDLKRRREACTERQRLERLRKNQEQLALEN